MKLPASIIEEIERRSKNWGAPTVAKKHMQEIAEMTWQSAMDQCDTYCPNCICMSCCSIATIK